MRIGFPPAPSLLALFMAFPFLSAGAAELLDATTPLQYVPLQTPCRAVDTRVTGGPIAGGTFRSLNPAAGACSIPTPNGGTIAYALNITAIPHGPLNFLTVWPAGELQPTVSTLNSDGRIKANAAIVAGGARGKISVFASNTADVIVDVNGYFVTETPVPPTYTYFPLPPCRLVDTRTAGNTPGFGAPSLTGGQGRTFPLRFSGCNLPTDPQVYGGAFSLNVTAIPKGGKPLVFLTIWGTPQNYPVDQPPPPPPTSVLNAPTGATTANAAIVTVNIATDEAISVYASDDTDVLIDVNGYFGFSQANAGGLSLYTLPPCRVLDTRSGGGAFSGKLTIPVTTNNCGAPTTAQAYVFNATVLPTGPLNYLTLWPDLSAQPVVSTLNANDGAVTSNMAIVESTNGSVDAFAPSATQLILDISLYFAP
jgi:hypothetical protein